MASLPDERVSGITVIDARGFRHTLDAESFDVADDHTLTVSSSSKVVATFADGRWDGVFRLGALIAVNIPGEEPGGK